MVLKAWSFISSMMVVVVVLVVWERVRSVMVDFLVAHACSPPRPPPADCSGL
jgi:hypothetical protein